MKWCEVTQNSPHPAKVHTEPRNLDTQTIIVTAVSGNDSLELSIHGSTRNGERDGGAVVVVGVEGPSPIGISR
jgi:hypothetical protein